MPGWVSRFVARVRRVSMGALSLVPALIVAAAILALLKADPAHRVDYVKALAWPAVVAFGYFALRDLIHERLRNVSRFSVGGVEMEIAAQAQNAILEGKVRDVAAVMVPDAEPAGAQPLLPVPRVGEPNEEQVQAQLAELQQRQDAVETAIKAGAKWGYNMAPQYAEPPEPVIEWDEDGQPHITGATGRRRSEPLPSQQGFTGALARRYAVPREKVIADAENEVRRLEQEYLSLKATASSVLAGVTIKPQLDAAKDRLRRIDPSNHLLL